MAKRKGSKKGKGSYLSYEKENRLQKNRNRKLKKHLRKHPKDSQAEKALAKPKNPRQASKGSSLEEARPFVLKPNGEKLFLRKVGGTPTWKILKL